MRFSTNIKIDAAPQMVWDVLTDLPNWASWNTTITGTQGTISLHAKVKVSVTANPGRAFPVKVTALNAPRQMVWTGGMPLGTFVGTRTFELEPQAGGTHFTMTEVYTGLLAALITRSIPDLQPSFDEFATCLKAHAEQRNRTS
ncbi:MAG: SRPBCC domain-containing protein [Actinomycetes bacterium]